MTITIENFIIYNLIMISYSWYLLKKQETTAYRRGVTDTINAMQEQEQEGMSDDQYF